MKLHLIFAATALSLALHGPASALSAKQKVEKEITVTSDAGVETTQRVPAALVTPGEKVVYTIDFINDSAAPATDLVLAMPVPNDIRYLEGSAERDGAIVTFSTDGGTTFAARNALVLPAVGGGTRTATANDITHVQWKIAGPVAVGGTDSVAFKGRLR